MTYFNCHAHTEYSNIRLLDCINKPKSLIDTAISLGLSGIAITDHECLSAHMEVNQYAKEIKEKYPNFKIALGNEIYLVDERVRNIPYYHFILIAKDALGHKALRELSSTAWINSYVDRRLERVPTLKSELTEIVNKYKGHLIATSACLGGQVSSLIIKYLDAQDDFRTVEANEYYEQIEDFLAYCQGLFGTDFYLECQPAASKDQIRANKMLCELSKEYNIPLTIGTDAHYCLKKDRFIHKAYLNSKGGEREVDSFYEFTYLMDTNECKELLSKSIPEEEIDSIFQNTLDLQNKIQDYDLSRKQIIPKVSIPEYKQDDIYPYISCIDLDFSSNKWPTLKTLYEEGNDQERYWLYECAKSLTEKNLQKKTEYWDRLEIEADIIKDIGNKLDDCLFAYFNTFKHYIDLFWKCGSIVGPGRGSSTGFLSNYLLGITQLDPLRWDIKHWRFLNKERAELPSLLLMLGSCKKRVLTVA